MLDCVLGLPERNMKLKVFGPKSIYRFFQTTKMEGIRIFWEGKLYFWVGISKKYVEVPAQIFWRVWQIYRLYRRWFQKIWIQRKFWLEHKRKNIIKIEFRAHWVLCHSLGRIMAIRWSRNKVGQRRWQRWQQSNIILTIDGNIDNDTNDGNAEREEQSYIILKIKIVF